MGERKIVDEETLRLRLGIGDRALIQTSVFHGYDLKSAKVARTTKTQIVVHSQGRERRFRKKDGREVGSGYGPRLLVATEERLRQLEHQKACRAMKSALFQLDRVPMRQEHRFSTKGMNDVFAAVTALLAELEDG